MIFFFRHIGQCFQPAQTHSLENQNSGHVRVIFDNIGYFSKYFRPIIKLQTRYRQQQTELRNYWHTDISSNTSLLRLKIFSIETQSKMYCVLVKHRERVCRRDLLSVKKQIFLSATLASLHFLALWNKACSLAWNEGVWGHQITLAVQSVV